MVASAARRRIPFSGLRPIDVSRDLAQVADLIAEAFSEDMDPAGKRAVREMQMVGRWAFLFSWMDHFAPPGEGMAPGFVWIEEGRVVGNASVRRVGPLGRGWLIGNVAVAKAWRRRGIARALMLAAIDLAGQQRGDWLALQVRSDSMAAKNLYLSLDFKETGETTQYRRTRPLPVAPPDSPVEGRLRPARAFDAERIYALAQAAIPEELRWAEPLRRDEFWLGFDRRLGNWLAGRREAWWVIDSSLGLTGASHIEAPRPPYEGRLRVWVAPAQQGRYEDRLIRAALTSIGRAAQRPLNASVPSMRTAACAALAAAGFEVQRRLTHMRLELR
ncbi:MAG TPA: GNAT family N-acetyltransferase [Anaerolineae bacterium]|nr:GNAT family N-acetyltransferase [Anaerolineae bacterium]